LKFLYDADLRHVEILSAMSPEIQEWSHKSRPRINNLYLLTRPIGTAVGFFLGLGLCISVLSPCRMPL